MTLRIDLDERGRDLLIRFDYDKRLVEAVRQLPGRRFDPRARLWAVPAKHVDAVVGALLPHGFTLAPEVSGLAKPAERALPFATPTTMPTTMPAPPRPARETGAAATALTVSGLNHRVRDALRGAFPERLWVVGEVLDFDKSAGRRHRFFTLIDKAPGETRPLAQVEVALFETKIQELTDKLAAAEPPLALRDGLEIRVLGRVDLFPQSGHFQLVIEDIDPAHTLGKLLLTREQLLRELASKGLDGKNLALPLPRPALRVAVLASPTSDGWHDFVRQLQGTGLAFAVTVYPVRVQGAALRATMLAGLRHFAAHAAEYDVLCILRGGGSRTDLAGFDDRELAYAVARHPLKVLVGIGHERDRSVLDHIAQSCKTPTALAAVLGEHAGAEVARLVHCAERLVRAAASCLADQNADLQQRAGALRTTLATHLTAQRHHLTSSSQRLQHLAVACVLTQNHRLDLARARLRHASGAVLQRAAAARARARTRLAALAERSVERARGRLAAHDMRCRLLDPRAVLQRGYALVRRVNDGAIVTDAAVVQAAAAVAIEFRDGMVRADVTAVTIHAQPPPS